MDKRRKEEKNQFNVTCSCKKIPAGIMFLADFMPKHKSKKRWITGDVECMWSSGSFSRIFNHFPVGLTGNSDAYDLRAFKVNCWLLLLQSHSIHIKYLYTFWKDYLWKNN